MLAGELAEEIRYSMRLGEDQDGEGYTRLLDIVNQAGQRAVNAFRWSFLNGATASLTFDANGKADLPADFAELSYVGSNSRGWQPTTIEYVMANRGELPSTLVAVTTESTATGMKYILQSAGNNGEVDIVYRRGWLKLEKDSDPINMPDWMRPPLSELCRRYAELLEGSRESGVGISIVDSVIMGPVFLEARKRDGATQTQYGAGHGQHGNGCDSGSIYIPPTTLDWRKA